MTTTTIKAGYKQTEIGVIPEDWEVKTLGNIVDIVGGGTPSSSVSKYWNGKINWFTPTEIGVNKYVYGSKRKITENGLKSSSAKVLKQGSVLLTSRAGIGDMAILMNEACTNQGFQSLVVGEKNNNEFIYYLINTKKKELLEKASGSTFLEISPNNVRSILIPVPPLPEQKLIATTLVDTDELISSLDALIHKKRRIKEGAMQELLTGKKRLAGFRGEWEVKKLGEVFKITRGQVLSTNKMKSIKSSNYCYPVYSSQTLKNGVTGYYNNFLFKNAITWTTDGANAGDVKFRKGEFYCTNVCGVLLSEEGYANTCLAEAFGRVAKKYVSYIGNPKLMNNVVKNISIFFPPTLKEQQAIAKILSDMDTEITTLEQKREKYKLIKQGMMQQLLTGKIRLI